MRINYGPFVRTLEQQLELDEIVSRLKASAPKKPATTEQSASCARTLSMSERELAEYRARPLPENWKAVPEAKTIDEAVGARRVTPDEYFVFEQMRRAEKNTLLKERDDLPPISQETRELAASAFMAVGPAKVTEREVRRYASDPYKTAGPKEVWVELPWYKAIFHRLRGHKIRIDNK